MEEMTLKRGVSVPSEAPTDSADQVAGHILEAAQLPWAGQLAEFVKDGLESGYGLTQSEAIRAADGRIEPDQRFYDSELIGAAYILSEETRFTHFESWVILFNNNMGWRRVEYVACRYGTTLDPVTRGCVTVEEARPGPAVTEPPPLKIDTKEEKGKIPLIGWIAIGLAGAWIVSAMFGGKR